MNANEMVAITKYEAKNGFGAMNLRFSDTNELIVSWPRSIAPASHLEACEQALALVRAKS